MIPVSLKIKGLYSFVDEQFIDFSTLMESHLFGIFGKVGSGKSSILEAITFALYGQSERLLSRGDDRNYNMMNLQSNELFIEFIFAAGTPKVKYKAVASAKRNSKRFDDVKKIDRTLYRFENDEWIPIEMEKIPAIVGLSYDNFKRAIIIPQGKFQEFLALGSKDRSEMLKEIFNLQKFDLSAKTGQLYNRNKEEISHLSGQLEQLADVSPARLKAEKNTLKELTQTHTKLEAKLQKTEKKLSDSEKVKSLFEELKKAESDAKTYREKYEERFLAMEKEAKNIAYCQQFFKGDLELLESQENEVNQLKLELEKAKKDLQDTENQLVDANKAFQKAKEENLRKPEYQKIIVDLDKGISRSKFARAKEEIDHAWNIFRKELTGLEKQLEQIEINEKKLKSQLEKDEKKAPDLIELIKIRNWYEREKDILDILRQQEKELKSVQKELDELEKDKLRAVAPLLKDLPQLEKLSLEDCKKTLEETNLSFLQKLRKETENERKWLTQKALVDHAKNLKDGQACPVCGALEHPNILDAKDIDKKLSSVQNKKLTYEQFLDESRQVLQNLASLIGQAENFKARISQIKSESTKQKKAHEAYQKTKFWTDKSILSLADIQKEVAQAEALNKLLKALKEKIAQNELDFDKKQSELKRLRPQLEAKEKERNQLQTKIDLLSEQMDAKMLEKIKAYSESELKDLIAKYQKKMDSAESVFLAREQELKALHTQQTALATTIKIKTHSLDKESKVLAQINQKLLAQMAQSPFSGLPAVLELLAKNIDPGKQLERVENYKNEAFAKKQKWKSLQEKTKNLSFDEDEFSKLQSLVKTEQEAIKTIHGNIIKTKSVIQELTQKVAQKQALEKKLKALERRAENIKTLAQLFKGQGFVNFISSVYLQNIVKAANQRFKNLTKHELALELAEDNSFRIRDRLNGGKIRHIKTLSGGQTFQAALCLALALADNIHELTKSERNFFFLDEGFGSQDNEAIADVFKTLKALRKENRTVGVISHVDSLQQEIEVHLMVTKDDQKGSIIHQSWR